MTDVIKPSDDPFSLIGHSWPRESESAYRTAEMMADEAATSAQAQSQSATDSARKTSEGMQGQTSDSVSGKYVSIAAQLDSQGQHYRTISGWMLDASGEVSKAKNRIAALVRAGTSEIREALDSELSGTPVTPSSTELTDKYRADISSVSTKLATELDSIGHSLSGDSGASTTPSYVRTEPTSTAPTIQQAAHQEASGQTPEVEPHQLPEMPRAASAPSGTESPSAPVTPSVPSAPTHPVNPTLAGLIAGSGPSGAPASPSTSAAKSPSTPASAPAGQAHQSPEQHQNVKSPVLSRIPSVALPDLPAAAATIATAVTSSVGGHQLTTAPTSPGSSTPASTGTTPGTSGTPPMTPVTPGLAPIGGGLPTPPVVQAPPAPQVTPGTPQAGPQAPSAPQQSPVRGPAADLGWIQRTYGLAPSLDLPKSENTAMPALFITDLPEPEATLHRALATLRQAFDASGWSQPLAVARIKRGFETKLVYVTADAVSIHPHGVLLPQGVTPLDEMLSAPSAPELLGSLMVSDKLVSMIPRGWEIESVLSTVSGGEASQSAEQFQALVEGGELLDCTVSRGRDDVTADEALRVFARAAIGSGGVGELDAEAARIRASRWVGVQPQGYLDSLARFYLSDAAESMSQGSWGEAVYSAEKYLSVQQSKAQVA